MVPGCSPSVARCVSTDSPVMAVIKLPSVGLSGGV